MTKKTIFTDLVMQPIAHFSHAVRIGNLIHVGATAGTDAERRLAGVTLGHVDVAAQAKKMFDNVAVVLNQLGACLENTVRVKTYLADLRDLPIYRARFAETMGAIRPTHVVVGSAGFPLPQAAIELDLIAVVDAPIARFPDSGGNASSAADRYYCVAGPVSRAESTQEGFAVQVDEAFCQLRRRLAAGGRKPTDTVYVHATLSDVRFAELFRIAFDAFFPPPSPACVTVIAQLPEVAWLLQLEVVAVEGGGVSIQSTLPQSGFDLGSPAVLAGDELYIGGQCGIGPDGCLASGGEAQTRMAWHRIASLLTSTGMTTDDVLRTNNVLTDWRTYSGFNAGYGANVSKPYPPRATVFGNLIAEGALVQMEAVAHRDGRAATIVQAGNPAREK